MERIWLDSYPSGVPHDIDMSQLDSMLSVLNESCLANAHKPAYSNFGHRVNFAEIAEMTRQFALYLQQDLGLQKGDRIAIMLPNIIQYPVVVFSAIRLGLVIVNIDPMYTQRELILQLKDSGANTIVVLENFAREVEIAMQSVAMDNVLVTKIGDCLPPLKGIVINTVIKHVKKAVPAFNITTAISFKSALRKYKGNTGALSQAELTHSDLLFLQYTGGTTGVPKGVEITHGNMVCNVLMSEAWIDAVFDKSKQQSVIAPLPMYHIFCMAVNLMGMMKLGVENILVTNPRDFAGFVKLLQKQKFTGFVSVTTLLRKLMDTPGFDDIDFSELKLTFAGGMAVTRDVADEWHQRTGCSISEAYGLSECSPGVSSVPLDMEFTGTIGVPMPSTHIKLLDDNDNEVGINESGELCVKGPQVMRGYWNNPEATNEVMTHDGFLRTGDYASIDERGYLRILDRKKDMILVSGFNVFPNEIEDVLNQHDGIVESAAIGIDDREAGQVVKLFVVKSDKNLSENDVRAYCKEQLTGYKRPKQIEFIDELPKSTVGKILRKELR